MREHPSSLKEQRQFDLLSCIFRPVSALCRRHHQLRRALPGLALLNMGWFPKDERSRAGERGKRGAVLQCD